MAHMAFPLRSMRIKEVAFFLLSQCTSSSFWEVLFRPLPQHLCLCKCMTMLVLCILLFIFFNCFFECRANRYNSRVLAWLGIPCDLCHLVAVFLDHRSKQSMLVFFFFLSFLSSHCTTASSVTFSWLSVLYQNCAHSHIISSIDTGRQFWVLNL